MNVASACICIPIWQFVGILAISFLVASKSHSLNLTKQKGQCPKLVLVLARRFLAFLASQLMLLVASQSLVWLVKQSLVLYCGPPLTRHRDGSGKWALGRLLPNPGASPRLVDRSTNANTNTKYTAWQSVQPNLNFLIW